MHPCNNLPGYHPRSGDRLGRKTLGGSLFAAHKRILELNLCCICNNGGGLLRWFDEGGQPETRPLAREVYRALGSERWDDLIEVVYGGGRRRVAALAPAVARAAEAGDEAATEILERAGAELAGVVGAIFTRLGEALPVVFSGGVAQNRVVAAALEHHLPANGFLKRVSSEPVRAAAELALELAGTASERKENP